MMTGNGFTNASGREFAEALNCPVSEISPSVANQLEAAPTGYQPVRSLTKQQRKLLVKTWLIF